MNRKLSILLVILLALAMCLPGTISHADPVILDTAHNSSHDVEQNIEITLGESLKITQLPQASTFNYLMILTSNEKQYSILHDYYSREQLLGGAQVYSFSSFADGKYYIRIETSDSRYGKYKSYLHQGDLSFFVKNGRATFLMPLVYENNKKLHISNRVDEFALSYYKKASYGIQSDSPEIKALANQITGGLVGDYAKVKAIHDWVCMNIWYDWDALRGISGYGDTSALGTLASKKSVCQGYASITAALLRASNIPAKLVSGYAQGFREEWTEETAKTMSTNHSWNEAYVDGRWIIIDSTWDSSNSFSRGQFSKDTGLRDHRYFDPILERFSVDHKTIRSEDALPNWWKDGTKTYYVDNRGIKSVGWKNIEGKRYHFGLDGTMSIGWKVFQGKTYYFDKVGAMVKGVTITISGKKYTFDINGVLKTKR